jgi:F-type H+-transporting ATPase subunit delta
MSVAKIYAKALYSSLQGKSSASDTYKKVKAELASLAELVGQNRSLEIALFSPASSSNEKLSVIEAILTKAGFDTQTGNFLRLLASKNRLALLAEIVDAMDAVRLEADGGVLGWVTSADPMEQADLEALTRAFSSKLKSPVELKVNVDPALLAGFKVTVGGVTYDGSLKQQLERLKIQFSAPVVGGKA